MRNKIRLTDYLDGMRSATTAAELEAAIQIPFKHSYHGRTWSAICKVRVEEGRRICAAHPDGRFVPQFGERRRLTVCGGVLFDWGSGYSEGFTFINWHCNKCADVFTEYMTQTRLSALRRQIRYSEVST